MAVGAITAGQWLAAGAAVAGAGASVYATKEAKKSAKAGQAEQAALLKKQEGELAAEEAKRKDRMGRARQGRRSLLYAEGDEAGVSKSTTLGG